MIKRLGAEFLGTFWLVLGGCGSAVLAANFGGDGNPLGIGFAGVALFADTAAVGQLWLFWLAPLLGGAIGGLIYKWLGSEVRESGA